MLLGRIVGSIWTSVKNERLEPYRLMLVQPHSWYLPSHQTDLIVAADMAQSGVGDDVIVVYGKPGRTQAGSERLCIDAAIVGVVDKISLYSSEMEHFRRPFAWIGLPPRDLEDIC